MKNLIFFLLIIPLFAFPQHRPSKITANLQTILDSKSIVSISNQANNLLLTSSGLDSINAESNLYFDGANLGIGTTSPSSELEINGDIKANTQTLTVLNGTKTASFTHDASSGDIGDYYLNTSTAVTISIHNLKSGTQATIFLNVGTLPSSYSVNTYSDAGSTSITNKNIGVVAEMAASKTTSITYTCSNDGTNTTVKLVYGQQE